jgi:hypothetical protein
MESFTIDLFPNPSAGEITLVCQSPDLWYYSLMDLGGRELHRGSFRETTRLDLAGYVDGLYILQVNDGEDIQLHRKFILKRK